ncbi:MAG: sulfite exporter TauE/SafE family protein [Pseudomonadota bacterium]
MYFPTSGVEANPVLLVLLSLAISTFTSMGGVSGAFLLLPYQVSVLNFTSPAVSPTNLVYNIVAIPSGVYRYIREGRMNWPITCVVIVGTLPGIVGGALVRIHWMPDERPFKLFVGCVLLYMGARLIYGQTGRAKRRMEKILEFEDRAGKRLQELVKEASQAGRGIPAEARVRTGRWGMRRMEFEFMGETFSFNVPALLLLSLVIGLVGGIYGIGGGAIIAPLLVTVFRLPIHTVAGAALAGTFFTSVAGVGVYTFLDFADPQSVSTAPDWTLGALFGIGGIAGMYIGAGLQKVMPASVIRIGLGLGISGLALKYVIDFFI